MDDSKPEDIAMGDASGETFDREYYATHCGALPYNHSCGFWAEFFGRIADELIRSFRPQRVFDAGCANGFLVESFWDRGVEAWGRDISRYANSDVRPDIRQYCSVGSIADPIEGRYDLVTCIEVLEHMPEAEAIRAIAAMTKATDRILFSSSPSDFNEPTHVNVHPAIYWLRLFAAQGFTPDMTYDATFILPHTLVLHRTDTDPREEDLAACAALVRTRLCLASRERTYAELEAERNKLNHELEVEKARSGQERAQFNDEIQAERARSNHAVEAERARSNHAIEAERARSNHAIEAEQAQANYDEAQLIRAICDLEAERVRAVSETDAAVQQRPSERDAQQARLIAQLEAQYQSVVTSTLWVSTAPLRAIGRWLPRPVRMGLRRSMGLARRGVAVPYAAFQGHRRPPS